MLPTSLDHAQPADTDSPGLRNIERVNLTEEVHRELARGLSSGRFLPGAKLGIRDLAEEMGISPTPVREALQQLVAEGALTQAAGRSFRVPELGPDDYRELRHLRQMLEGEAAALAAPRIPVSAIDQLEAMHQRLADAKAQANFKQAMFHNQEFHLRVCAESGAQRLLRIVEGLWLQMGPLLNMLYTRSGVPGPMQPRHGHLLLIDAFRARDPEAARRALVDDIAGSSNEILAALAPRRSAGKRAGE